MLRLTALSLIACLPTGWFGNHGVRRPVRIAATVVLFGMTILFFVAGAFYDGADELLRLGWYASLAVGATLLPLVAMLARPRRLGALLLATWTAAMLTASLPYLFEDFDGADPSQTQAAAILEHVALVAALGLAAYLWRHQRSAAQTSIPVA